MPVYYLDESVMYVLPHEQHPIQLDWQLSIADSLPLTRNASAQQLLIEIQRYSLVLLRCIYTPPVHPYSYRFRQDR